MGAESSATASAAVSGTALGALGVVLFSASLPATRYAVGELNPWFVAFGRAVGAGVLAVAYLWLRRSRRPSPDQARRLLVVAVGVVVGFPLFTSLALTTQTAAHGAVVIAVLPAVTAAFAVVRGRERPAPTFWVASGAGALVVVAFTVVSGATSGGLEIADGFLLVAVVLCGLGYAEGGALARELGGAEVVCWALVLSLPVTLPVVLVATALAPPHAGPTGWWGFAYVTVVSMFLGFFAWYAGLGRGGVARVGQVQLVQPILTLGWSVLLMGEDVPPIALVTAALVVACVAVTQRSRPAAPQAVLAGE